MQLYSIICAIILFDAISCQCGIRCPNTWVRYEDSCYLFSNNDAVHFTEAEHYCQHLGGHLVTIESSLENAFLRDHISRLKHENYWIGLTDQLIEGVFRWNITGPIPSFFDWGRADQPDDFRHNQDCVEFNHWSTGIHWNDRECTYDNFPLYAISCQCGIRCPNTWVRYEDSCYLFSNNDAVHFTEAEHYCQHLGGHLVTIESSLENAFLRDHISRLKHENYWIGLTDQLIEGVFRWNITGPIPSFFDWGRADQPDDFRHNQDCVEFNHWSTGIHWNDRECTYDNFPLCEKNLTSLMLTDEVVIG